MSLDVDVALARGGFRLEAAFAAPSGLTALFGRSGSGKSTLIDLIAGLTRPDRGRIAVDGRVLVDTAAGTFVPKHRRRLGYVFQDARLFPHLSVRQNLLYGHRFAPRGARRVDLDQIVELLGIGHLLARQPSRLSGGEKQRVAIGRALLASPELILMDEPLASLDEARKAEILPHIERLRDELRVPIVYVSHAVTEVARLASSVVVLDQGRVVATGPASEVLHRLGVPGLSGLPETGAVLEVRVVRHDEAYGLTVLAARAGELRVPRLPLPEGAVLRLRIAARDVMLSTRPVEGLSALNVLAGTIVAVGPPDGAAVEVKLDCGGDALIVRLTRLSLEGMGLRAGSAVYAIIKSVAFDHA